MHAYRTFMGLPISLLLLVIAQVDGQLPTAVRKMSPDENEKFFPEYVAFAEDEERYMQAPLSPRGVAAAMRVSREEEARLGWQTNSSMPYLAPFRSHSKEEHEKLRLELFRRAAAALSLLQGRQSCPSGMNSCASIGFSDRCCLSTEVCQVVPNSGGSVIACCPQGSTCSGPVGPCAADATTCPGGGCCVAGFQCQGDICIPTASATPTPAASPTAVQTLTTTQTTVLPGGNPSTTVVTVVVTITPNPGTTTSTTTEIFTASTPTTTQAVPPYLPTVSSQTTQFTTSLFCPTGFYACQASAGGGCCQTGRDCATQSCPPTPMTTIVTNGETVVVPVTDVPAQPSSTCAAGWYLCGSDAGPVPGCCPSQYNCGTASCTLISASVTAEVQKQFPTNAGTRVGPLGVMAIVAGMIMLLML